MFPLSAGKPGFGGRSSQRDENAGAIRAIAAQASAFEFASGLLWHKLFQNDHQTNVLAGRTVFQ